MILNLSQKLISAALIVVSSIAIGLGVVIGANLALMAALTALGHLHR